MDCDLIVLEMQGDLQQTLKNLIEREVSKCSFCGFCEYICPTYQVSKDRIYSPRGRINLIKNYILSGWFNDTVEKSIYTCLLCRACEPECPSNISIVDVILMFRGLIVDDQTRPYSLPPV